MSDIPPPQTPPGRTPLWIKLVLALSLALNFAIVGVVAGFALRGPVAQVRAGGPPNNFGMPYLMALEKADRRAVFDAVRDNPDLPDRRKRRAHFRDVLEALRQEPLDPAALAALLATQAEAVGQVQSVAQAAWLDKVESMSMAERMAYADKVEDVLRRGPRRKDGPPQRQ